jgi:hypothetical protein
VIALKFSAVVIQYNNIPEKRWIITLGSCNNAVEFSYYGKTQPTEEHLKMFLDRYLKQFVFSTYLEYIKNEGLDNNIRNKFYFLEMREKAARIATFVGWDKQEGFLPYSD